MEFRYLLIFLFLFAISCSPDTQHTTDFKDKWKIVDFQSPKEDSILQNELSIHMERVDTFTQIPKELTGKYAGQNLDSFKSLFKAELNERYTKLKKEKVLPFQSITFSGDTVFFKLDLKEWHTAYYIAVYKEKQFLFFDQFVIDNTGDIKCYQILYHNNDSLIIKSHDNKSFPQIITLRKG